MMLMSQPVEYIQDFQAEQSTEEQLSVTSDSLLGTKDPLKESNQSTDKIKTHSDTNSLVLSVPYRSNNNDIIVTQVSDHRDLTFTRETGKMSCVVDADDVDRWQLEKSKLANTIV